MLNEKGVRELAYVVRIDGVEPIIGRDRVECVKVGGWTIMCRKGMFKPGDLGIYFEIDSKVPATSPFMFLEGKHFKIKTQKYALKDADGNKCGQFWSQGLLMSAQDFGWVMNEDRDAIVELRPDKSNVLHSVYHVVDDESRFLTAVLGVTYSVAEDNKRKGKGPDKYKKMAQRHGKLFSHQPFRWLMQREWGRKLLFKFFGKKKDKRNWPEWVVKTDEERVQNMPWILEDKSEWIVTEKIDGTSTTFTMKRGKRGKYEFYVCSRNVMFDDPNKNCYYDTNVYLEMAEKYKVKEALTDIMDKNPQYEWVTLQGETYGAGVQKRDYSLIGHNFMGFNFITSETGRWDSRVAEKLTMSYGIPWVPIIGEHFVMPDTVDELLDIATGESVVDGLMREGLVFRSPDGSKSFKAVSNEFLMKYHS